MAGCQQQLTDTAEFNRLLIEENRRLRAANDKLISPEKWSDDRERLMTRIDILKDDVDTCQRALEAAEAKNDKLLHTLSNAALEAAFNRSALEELPEFLRGQRKERQAVTRELAKTTGWWRFWSTEAFRLAEKHGWQAFGSHLTRPDVLKLEFDGKDEAGEPLWERPVQVEPKDESKVWKRERRGHRFDTYRYHDGVLQWRNLGQRWVASGHSSLEEITERWGDTFTEVTS